MLNINTIYCRGLHSCNHHIILHHNLCLFPTCIKMLSRSDFLVQSILFVFWNLINNYGNQLEKLNFVLRIHGVWKHVRVCCIQVGLCKVSKGTGGEEVFRSGIPFSTTRHRSITYSLDLVKASKLFK